MISLNDYLYSGNTVLKILLQYSGDLKKEAIETGNTIDLAHSNFLVQIIELLEHTDFLTSQSQRIKEFYLYMTQKYPFLAFTFKGRIKSLIRAEEKFNAYVLEYIYNYYKANERYPSDAEIKNNLHCFRDLIAYRIVISLPVCHIQEGESREEQEKTYLYEIANALPAFLEERGFTSEMSGHTDADCSEALDENNRFYLGIMFCRRGLPGISRCILLFMIIWPAAIRKYSFVLRIWMTLQRSGTQIISATKRRRRNQEASGISFRKGSAGLLMKHTGG